MWFRMTPTPRSRGTAHAHCQFCHQNGLLTLLSSITQQRTQLEAQNLTVSSDVNRGSKNRNSLQFRVLEIEFLNSKLDFTF